MSESILSQVFLNREASRGVAGTTYYKLPVNPPSVTDTYESIVDNGLRGVSAKDFGVYQGCGQSEVTLEGMWYPEELGYLCYGILGGTAGTPSVGGGSAGTWQFTVADTCPSFTIIDYPKIGTPGSTAEVHAFKYSMMLMSNLTIKFNAGEGAVTWSAGFTGQNAGTIDGSSVLGSAIGTVAAPLLGWYGSVDVGTYANVLTGGTATAYTKLVDAEISISREVMLNHTAQNTQSPSYIFHGPTEVTMTATSKFFTINDYLKYKNNTQEAIKVTLTRGSGTALKGLEILLPSIAYMDKPMEIDRSQIAVYLGWGVRAFYDSTLTDKVVRLRCINSQATYPT